MNRPIKFRAWYGDKDYVVCPSSSFSLVLHDTGHLIQLWSSDGLVDEFPVTKLDQFTGLLDKNGKEIYESDLVTFKDFENAIGQVVFRNAYVGGWIVVEPAFKKGAGYSLGARSQYEIEVVGNIFQNEDLLNDS